MTSWNDIKAWSGINKGNERAGGGREVYAINICFYSSQPVLSRKLSVGGLVDLVLVIHSVAAEQFTGIFLGKLKFKFLMGTPSPYGPGHPIIGEYEDCRLESKSQKA